MFSKIANFFIQNSKLTLVLVIVSIIVGIGSYFVLPKQYNPTIVVPAFQITVPSFGLSAQEVSNLIVIPLENKIMELEGIDEVYGVSYDNFAGVMAKFDVGIDKEDAKIRLNQKLQENMGLKPIGVGEPKIVSIDPEELSQLTYSINYIGEDLKDSEQIQIYLRQIAILIKEEVKTIPNVTTMEIVGGLKKDIIIELDLDKIQARNTDIMQIYEVLKNNNISSPSGDIRGNNEKVFVEIDARLNNIENIKKIVILNINGNPLYLEDVASIRYGTKILDKTSFYTDSFGKKETILLGFGKKTGTNAVFVTENIIKK